MKHTQSPRSPNMRMSRSVCFILSGLLLAIIAVGGWMLMFATFRPYDDEGCLLYPLLNFARYGGLYNDIFSFYGPVYSLFYYGLYLLGLPLTNMDGRWVTWLLWLGSAVGTACLTWRTTRGKGLGWGLVALVSISLLLEPLITEPIHMASLMALIMALMAWGGWEALIRNREAGWAMVCAAGAIMLILIKINIGIFAIFSMGALWWLHNENWRLRQIAPWLLSILVIILIWSLMGVAWTRDWVANYGITFILAALSLIWTPVLSASITPMAVADVPYQWDHKRRDLLLSHPWRVLLSAVVTAVVVSGVICVVVMNRGTTLSAMFECLVYEARKFSSLMSLPFTWPPQLVVSGICSIGILTLVFFLTQGGNRRMGEIIVIAIRLMLLFGLVSAVVIVPAKELPPLLMPFATIWIWCFAWPLEVYGNRYSKLSLGMSWLCWFALGQWLHSFAVAGNSQMALSSFLIVPIVLTGAAEAWEGLYRHEFSLSKFSPKIKGVTFLVMIIALFGSAARFEIVGAQYLEDRHSLNLFGAEKLRLPDEQTLRYRVFSSNIAAHADVLFSVPQLMSYNLWSGISGPTKSSGVLWYAENDHYLKGQTMNALQKHSRSMLLVEDAAFDEKPYMLGIRADDPLYLYLKANYKPAITMGAYSLRVRNGRVVTPLLVAYLSPLKEPSKATMRLRAVIPMNADSLLASIDIVRLNKSRTPLISLSESNARELLATPMNLDGTSSDIARKVALPLKAQGAVMIEMLFDADPARFMGEPLMIVLRDPSGEEIGLAFLAM